MINAKRNFRPSIPHLWIPQRRVIRPRCPLPGLAPLPSGKLPLVMPGTTNFLSIGTFNFTVPVFNTITFQVRGPGGGGGGAESIGGAFIAGSNGGAGAGASIARAIGGGFDLIAFGGGGGTGGTYTGLPFNGVYTGVDGVAGAFGSASGGTTNLVGSGQAGGLSGINVNNVFGSNQFGGGGGPGGFTQRSFTPAQLPYFTVITIVCSAGGAPGANGGDQYTSVVRFATAGASGVVNIIVS